MAKKNLHPDWYITKVYCEGELVLEVGGTKTELTVEIWSGNHPLYNKSKKLASLRDLKDFKETKVTKK